MLYVSNFETSSFVKGGWQEHMQSTGRTYNIDYSVMIFGIWHLSHCFFWFGVSIPNSAHKATYEFWDICCECIECKVHREPQFSSTIRLNEE